LQASVIEEYVLNIRNIILRSGDTVLSESENQIFKSKYGAGVAVLN